MCQIDSVFYLPGSLTHINSTYSTVPIIVPGHLPSQEGSPRFHVISTIVIVNVETKSMKRYLTVYWRSIYVIKTLP